MDIYIIGVANHAFQVPGKRPKVEATAFMSLLQITCRQYQVRAIAEEMSPEALDGQQESTCKHIADTLHLSHRYCDPNSAKRKELGIIEWAAAGLVDNSLS